MNPEERLRDALHRAEAYEPSPDLFARVRRSIEEDAAHRSRVRRALALAVGGVSVLVGWFALTAERSAGRIDLPWWSIEIAADAVLVAIVVVLGPLIRRFGESYAGDVFRSNPPTGDRFLALFDVAYYLVFTGYVLLTARFSPDPGWAIGGVGAQFEDAAFRIGGMVLLMGVLHGAAIAGLPVIGLLFASTWRRGVRAEQGPSAAPEHRRAQAADRVAAAISWAFVALAVIGALGLVFITLAVGRA